MKIDNKIRFGDLCYYLSLEGEIIYNKLDSLPVVLEDSYPESMWDVSFRKFISAVKYAKSIKTAPEFVAKVISRNPDLIKKERATKIYPLYIHYLQSTEKILKLFMDVNSEIESSGQPLKTMEEYGLTNIIDLIADGRLEKFDYFYDKTTDFIFTEYRRKIYKQINIIENSKKRNGKNI